MNTYSEYMNSYERAVVVKASVLQSVDLGLNPMWSHIKDFKNGLFRFSACCSARKRKVERASCLLKKALTGALYFLWHNGGGDQYSTCRGDPV